MTNRPFLALFFFGTILLSAPAEDGFEPIFNGQNLEGWHSVVPGINPGEPQDIFTVNDGVIHVYASQTAGSKQPFGGLITDAVYADYHFTLEYKWGEKKFAPRETAVRDAGLCFHLHGDEVIWPPCVELQIQEGDTGDIWIIDSRASARTNSTYHFDPKGKLSTRGAPDQRYARFSRNYSREVAGWNKIELIVEGDRATYIVNGFVVNVAEAMKRFDAAAAQHRPLTQGRILLQAEGAEIFYRDIKIKSIEP